MRGLKIESVQAALSASIPATLSPKPYVNLGTPRLWGSVDATCRSRLSGFGDMGHLCATSVWLCCLLGVKGLEFRVKLCLCNCQLV